MDFRSYRKISGFILAAVATLSLPSCIENNYELGSSLIPADEMYDVYRVDIPLSDIQIEYLDGLTGYSNDNIVVGALRDSEYGLTTRSSAITVVPLNEELDFGKNPKFRRFHAQLAKDTVSVKRADEASSLQNIYIYELNEPLDTAKYEVNTVLAHKSNRVTQGIPVYNGGDSLTFDFSKEYAERFFQIDTTVDLADMKSYVKKFPGIYLESEKPVGAEGGRINLFKLQLDYDFDYYYIKGNYAQLSFSAEYDGVRKDTSFFFYFSPLKFYDMDSLISAVSSSGSFPQYCQNVASHETAGLKGKATDKVYIEGGAGLMPTITARQIYDGIFADIKANGREFDIKSSKDITIGKASIIMPFEFPADYKELDNFPDYLSPCKKVVGEKSVSYANLTDYTSTDENPGNINRSVGQYAPDVTYHVQQMLHNATTKTMSDYDIRFTIMANKVEESSSSSSDSSLSDYYNYLSYASYYNQLYGGYGGYGGYGYGSYGGYGGYGDYYSNYYSYMMMASMYGSSSSSSTTSTVVLDKDRYYKAVLCGPTSSNKPYIRVVYALPKKK